MNKCEYCKRNIEKGKIRCESCNLIWNSGVEFGKKVIRLELREIFNDLKELCVKQEEGQ